MEIFKSIRKLFWFILMIEEIIFWQPPQTNSLVENLINMLVNAMDTYPKNFYNIYWLNPAVIIFLFAISAKPMINLFKAFLIKISNTSMILFLNRIIFIRILIIAGLLFYIIMEIRKVLNSNYFSLLDLYMYKQFWLMILGARGLIIFLTPDPELGDNV